MANLCTLVGFLVIIFFNVFAPASSASHPVEWSLGKDYSSLATGKSFAVGDTIGMYIYVVCPIRSLKLFQPLIHAFDFTCKFFYIFFKKMIF